MTPIEQQTQELQQQSPGAMVKLQPSGGYLIEVPNFRMPPGWNREIVTILFFAPPGYPAGQPDCFWVEPGPVRLQNGIPHKAPMTRTRFLASGHEAHGSHGTFNNGMQIAIRW